MLWILPGLRVHGARTVTRLVESPSAPDAAVLRAEGAVWNSLVCAVSGRTLVDLYREALPEILEPFLQGLATTPTPSAVRAMYAMIPPRDFSRDLLERVTRRLALVIAPPCGWSELATPERLRRFLDSSPKRPTESVSQAV